jgi:hypothetical protein
VQPIPEHLKGAYYTVSSNLMSNKIYHTVRVNVQYWETEQLLPLEQLWPQLTDEDRHTLTMLALIEYETDPTQMATKILCKMNGWVLFTDGEMQGRTMPVVPQEAT